MVFVTEVVIFAMEPGADLAPLEPMRKTLLEQPGCRRVRYSKQHEDAAKLVLFVDWEDVSSHELFVQSPGYGSFLANIAPLITAPPAPYHVPFDPSPPTVLDNFVSIASTSAAGKSAVAEVAHAYFPTGDEFTLQMQQDALIAVQQFIDETKEALVATGGSGECAHGFALEEVEWKGEMCRALVLVLGWESIEAHMAFRKTEVFKEKVGLLRGMAGSKGMTVWHVKNEVFVK
ncbi:uncharacterized protein BCR38DRAFT_446992 [Pseudomassariella vexata]|uniref:ABM domain-containing protein n=1 Tax=Pseudomassariella vexata TaxID=1141098 RepID=A0A1Y2DI59_9PEZI|nr:uncharacterized protein BCR38DRAFT_446992 [Pseudomassariella vexata]ORY58910.1 hypothetical protein BCR38DRAFT_446992 [Pseudomassariella vexata]